eukprot:GHVO01023291.1.p1 GENE.GHVO01023291.1~~GHVO01023291.1.p1  ORF type:complete len:188 (-),score=24.30 GHVO01023291.1:140-703(-)
MMADLSDIRSPRAFIAQGDASAVSQAWTAWLEEFEAYADSRNLFVARDVDNNQAQRKALLMYIAGAEVREVLRNVQIVVPNPDPGVYFNAVAGLNAQFIARPNVTYQRHMFRKMRQEEETVSHFATRLRHAVATCGYAAADRENILRDQVIEGCRSDKLRRKLLERGDNLTLNDALTIAATDEAVES